jgi:hypothetical protein
MLRRGAWLVAMSCAISVLGWSVLGCEAAQPIDTPDGAVREFVSRIGGFRGAEDEANALLELLSARARTNLEARAKRYGAASGKQIAPSAMLVPSRFVPRFQPQTYSAQIVGKYAMVDIQGVSPEQVAQVPCVLEEDGWHVDLVLPELPPPQLRPGAED